MSDRSELISKLKSNKKFREAYIGSKLGTLVPAQIKALRLNSDMPRQADLALESGMKQSRISAIETPGATNFTLETLTRLASVFKVGLVVKFVPFNDLLRWDTYFSPDTFDVTRLDQDSAFLEASSEMNCFTAESSSGQAVAAGGGLSVQPIIVEGESGRVPTELFDDAGAASKTTRIAKESATTQVVIGAA